MSLCVIFNQTSHLLDLVAGAATSPGVPGTPVILNASGILDPSMLNTGGSVTVGSSSLTAGMLVNVFNSGSVLTARPASAAPGAGQFQAQGFVIASAISGSTTTVFYSGVFPYTDLVSEFSSADIGAEIYLSAAVPGGITKTRPTTVANITASASSGTAFTVTANNSFGVGTSVVIAGLTAGAALNGTRVVASATPTQFTVSVASPSYATTGDSGTATQGAVLDQSVGYVIGYSTGVVTAMLIAGFKDFSQISGVASPSQLPTPTTSSIGGVQAVNAVSHQWVNAISTAGVPNLSQPSSADLSDIATLSSVALRGVTIGSTPPSNGQVLVATSAIAATWQTFSSSGTVASSSVGLYGYYSGATTVTGVPGVFSYAGLGVVSNGTDQSSAITTAWNTVGSSKAGILPSGGNFVISNTVAPNTNLFGYSAEGQGGSGQTNAATNFVYSPTAVVLSLTSVATGTGVYTGTITGGGSNAFSGKYFTIAGFVTSANNGTFFCSNSTTTTLTLVNASSVSETIAATATLNQTALFLDRSRDSLIGRFTLNMSGAASATGLAATQQQFNGTVNTSGTAVTWVSGSPFVSSLVGLTITINGSNFTVSLVNSSTSITLSTSAGTQTGVAFTITSGSGISSHNFYHDITVNSVGANSVGMSIGAVKGDGGSNNEAHVVWRYGSSSNVTRVNGTGFQSGSSGNIRSLALYESEMNGHNIGFNMSGGSWHIIGGLTENHAIALSCGGTIRGYYSLVHDEGSSQAVVAPSTGGTVDQLILFANQYEMDAPNLALPYFDFSHVGPPGILSIGNFCSANASVTKIAALPQNGGGWVSIMDVLPNVTLANLPDIFNVFGSANSGVNGTPVIMMGTANRCRADIACIGTGGLWLGRSTSANSLAGIFQYNSPPLTLSATYQKFGVNNIVPVQFKVVIPDATGSSPVTFQLQPATDPVLSTTYAGAINFDFGANSNGGTLTGNNINATKFAGVYSYGGLGVTVTGTSDQSSALTTAWNTVGSAGVGYFPVSGPGGSVYLANSVIPNTALFGFAAEGQGGGGATNAATSFFWSAVAVSLVLTSVATGTGVYTGTITGGGSNALAGKYFTVSGFTTPANNGTFQCLNSTATTLTLKNATSVAETHAATAVLNQTAFFLDRHRDSIVGRFSLNMQSMLNATGIAVTQQNPTGTCDTSGTSATWDSGAFFPAVLTTTGIFINSVHYNVTTVNSPTSLTLSSSAGTQTAVAFTFNTGNGISSHNSYHDISVTSVGTGGIGLSIGSTVNADGGQNNEAHTVWRYGSTGHGTGLACSSSNARSIGVFESELNGNDVGYNMSAGSWHVLGGLTQSHPLALTMGGTVGFYGFVHDEGSAQGVQANPIGSVCGLLMGNQYEMDAPNLALPYWDFSQVGSAVITIGNHFNSNSSVTKMVQPPLTGGSWISIGDVMPNRTLANLPNLFSNPNSGFRGHVVIGSDNPVNAGVLIVGNTNGLWVGSHTGGSPGNWFNSPPLTVSSLYTDGGNNVHIVPIQMIAVMTAANGTSPVTWQLQAAVDPITTTTYGGPINVDFGTNSNGGILTGNIINAATGLRISGAATTGHVLRGNGTNYVDAQLAFSDIGGTASSGQYVTMVGDSGSGGTKGAVPAPAAGDAASHKFLQADGTWAVPPGTGGLTSVGLSTNATWFTVANSPLTANGTITLNATTGLTANQVLATPNGSTGVVALRSLVSADLPSGYNAWSNLVGATSSVTIANAGFTTEFDQTSSVAWTWKNTTIATVSTTNNSPIHQFVAEYWTGAASADDIWSIKSSLAAGTNGASLLTFSQSGSSGNAAVLMPMLLLNTSAHGISYSNSSVSFCFGNGTAGDTSARVNATSFAIGGQVVLIAPGGELQVGNSGGLSSLALYSGSTQISFGSTSGLRAGSAMGWTWSSNTVPDAGGADTGLFRLNAAAVAVGNGTASNTSGVLLANGGFGVSLVSTAAITGAVPVKADTSNANQVVVTTTTDTGAGIVVGVCINSPGAGGNAQVVASGIVSMTLGTGTAAIGNWVIVDTTTNGRVKCVGTYPTAGTVIGVAMSAQASVGSAFNVMVGLK